MEKNPSQPKAPDQNKRSFLKLLGTGGLVLLGSALLPGRAVAMGTGGANVAPVTGLKDANEARNNAASDDTLVLVKNQAEKLSFDADQSVTVTSATAFSGQRKNLANATINPAKQETLALIQGKSDTLTFSRGTELNTTGTAPALASAVNVKDTSSATVSPAQLETTQLWRRMVKMMESQASADININQRVAVDSWSTNIDVGVGVTGANTPLVALASDAGNVVTGISTPSSYNGWDRQMFQDVARDTYARSIRKSLIFS